jgi:hypothetical protein
LLEEEQHPEAKRGSSRMHLLKTVVERILEREQVKMLLTPALETKRSVARYNRRHEATP